MIDKAALSLVALRSAALALALGGQTRASNHLYTLADLVESGQATDEHMRLVADKLRSRDITGQDWQDVLERIETDSARLQAADPSRM